MLLLVVGAAEEETGIETASRSDDAVIAAASGDEVGVAVTSTENFDWIDAVSAEGGRLNCSTVAGVGDGLGIDVVSKREEVLWDSSAVAMGNKVDAGVYVTWRLLEEALTMG